MLMPRPTGFVELIFLLEDGPRKPTINSSMLTMAAVRKPASQCCGAVCATKVVGAIDCKACVPRANMPAACRQPPAGSGARGGRRRPDEAIVFAWLTKTTPTRRYVPVEALNATARGGVCTTMRAALASASPMR